MDHPLAPGEPAWIAADRKTLPPRVLSRYGRLMCDTAPLGHDASPPLVPSRTGGRGSLSMPGRQHVAGSYEVLAPNWTHSGGTDPLQCSPHTGTGISTPSVCMLSGLRVGSQG